MERESRSLHCTQRQFVKKQKKRGEKLLQQGGKQV